MIIDGCGVEVGLLYNYDYNIRFFTRLHFAYFSVQHMDSTKLLAQWFNNIVPMLFIHTAANL